MKKVLLLLFSITFLYSNQIKLEISGNIILKNKTIYNYLELSNGIFNVFLKKNKIEKKDINIYKEKLLDLYKEKGFYKTNIKIIKLNNKIIFSITEGRRLFFKKITVNNKNKFSNKEIYNLIEFKLGESFDIEKYNKTKKNIQLFLLKKNIPTPLFQIKIILDEKDLTLLFSLYIPKQNKIKIENIKIINNTKIQNSFLKNKILLKKGDFYSYRAEVQTYNNLINLKIFKNINIDKNIKNKKLYIKIYTKNTIKNHFKTSIGFDSQEYIKMRLKLRTSNFLNTYGNLENILKLSSVNQYIMNKYTKNFGLNSYISNNVLFEHRKNRKFEFNKYSFNLGYHKKYKGTHHLILNYSENDVKYDFFRNNRYNYIIGSLIYKYNWNNIKKKYMTFLPLSGINFNFYLENSNKLLSSKYNFFKIKSSFSILKDIYSGNKLFIKTKYKNIITDSSIQLPTPLLISVGGIFSNRGLNVESAYTNKIFENTIELHTKIYDKLFLINFLDDSYFNNIEIEKNINIQSIGIGFRYTTKIGVFKLDFGKNISKYLDNSLQINFGYGYGF